MCIKHFNHAPWLQTMTKHQFDGITVTGGMFKGLSLKSTLLLAQIIFDMNKN